MGEREGFFVFIASFHNNSLSLLNLYKQNNKAIEALQTKSELFDQLQDLQNKYNELKKVIYLFIYLFIF